MIQTLLKVSEIVNLVKVSELEVRIIIMVLLTLKICVCHAELVKYLNFQERSLHDP